MKKTIIYSALLAVFTTLAFDSCKKYEDIASNSIPSVKTALRGAECWTGIDKECGLLKFTDFNHFQSVYECLENEYEAYCDSFETIHGSLSDSAYNHLIDSIGWDEEDMLADFESAASHHSYRFDLNQAEDAWLSSGISGSNPWDLADMDDAYLLQY